MKQTSALISQTIISALDNKCTTEINNNFITLKEYTRLMKVQTTISHSTVHNSILKSKSTNKSAMYTHRRSVLHNW
jgi:hypothetical protein